MARGWESKSVEEQIQLAESKPRSSSPFQVAPEERRRQREREDLELSRSRILQELTLAIHPRHRELLQAIRHTEKKLTALTK
jgi:hypothetical protein